MFIHGNQQLNTHISQSLVIYLLFYVQENVPKLLSAVIGTAPAAVQDNVQTVRTIPFSLLGHKVDDEMAWGRQSSMTDLWVTTAADALFFF